MNLGTEGSYCDYCVVYIKILEVPYLPYMRLTPQLAELDQKYISLGKAWKVKDGPRVKLPRLFGRIKLLDCVTFGPLGPTLDHNAGEQPPVYKGATAMYCIFRVWTCSFNTGRRRRRSRR